jgi:tetratricopeptide (TPR) repeat protein
LILGLGLAATGVLGQTNAAAPAQARAVADVRATFHEARERYQKEPGNVEAVWQFGRACFDLAEQATNKTERAAIAEQGIAACRKSLEHQSNSAPLHYYLGMDLAELAQTKELGALKLVSQMRHEFSVVRDLDEHFDQAGADRNLGMLYRDAPSLISIGNRGKAKQHLQRAVELVPDYPGNRLEMIDAYVKWSERPAAQRELKALEDSLPRARSAFSGPAWAGSWTDWEQQLQQFKKKLGTPAKPLEAPSKSK